MNDEIISISIKINENKDLFSKVPPSYEFLDLDRILPKFR